MSSFTFCFSSFAEASSGELRRARRAAPGQADAGEVLREREVLGDR
jgi:hypothetical protein